MFSRTIVRSTILFLLFAFICVHFCNASDDADSPESGDRPTSGEDIDDDVLTSTSSSVLKVLMGVSTTSTTTTTTTTTTTPKPTTKRKSSTTNRNNKSKNRRRKTHPQNLSSKNALVEFVPDMSELKPEQTCLIGDVCMRNGKLGYCYKPHEPIHYERDARDTEDFVEMMQESCTHFFDANENLKHPLCCSPEQEETIARLNANIDLIRKSCPSCLYNVKRLFCNIFCAPNQRDFLRVERVKGETVMEVTVAISAEFVSTFFSSCRDVRVFGAYLLDYDYGCGKHRRANCTALEFIKVLGGLSEIPFNFKPLIVDSATVNEKNSASGALEAHAWPTTTMNDTAYNCHEAPPNQASCHCDHCPKSCKASQRPSHLLTGHSSSNNGATSKSHKSSPTPSSKEFSRRSSSATNTFMNSTFSFSTFSAGILFFFFSTLRF